MKKAMIKRNTLTAKDPALRVACWKDKLVVVQKTAVNKAKSSPKWDVNIINFWAAKVFKLPAKMMKTRKYFLSFCWKDSLVSAKYISSFQKAENKIYCYKFMRI